MSYKNNNDNGRNIHHGPSTVTGKQLWKALAYAQYSHHFSILILKSSTIWNI